MHLARGRRAHLRAACVGLIAFTSALVALSVVAWSASASSRERAWSPPETLSAAGAESNWPAVTVGPHGDVVAVWARGPAGTPGSLVEAATRRARRRWVRESVGPALGAPELLDVAASRRRAAVAVYRAAEGTVSTPVAVSRGRFGRLGRSDQAHHGADQQVLPPGPSVAMDARGDAVAVWSDALSGVTFGAARSLAGAWATPSALSDPFADGYSAPTWDGHVAMSPRGVAVAAWTREVFAALNPETSTWTRRSRAWTPGAAIPDSGDTEVGSPGVGVDARGEPVVALSRRSGEQAYVYAAERVGDAWSLRQLSEPAETFFATLQIAVGRRGDAVVVWSEADDRQLVAVTRSPGGAWSAPEILPSTSADQRLPRVAVDNRGSPAVAWVGATDTGDVVEVTQRSRDGAWSPPQRRARRASPQRARRARSGRRPRRSRCGVA